MEFVLDEGEKFLCLAGGEGGVDPVVSRHNGVGPFPGSLENLSSFTRAVEIEEKVGVQEADFGVVPGSLGRDRRKLLANRQCLLQFLSFPIDPGQEKVGLKGKVGHFPRHAQLKSQPEGFVAFSELFGESELGGRKVLLEFNGLAEILNGVPLFPECAILKGPLEVELRGGLCGNLFGECLDGLGEVGVCGNTESQDHREKKNAHGTGGVILTSTKPDEG